MLYHGTTYKFDSFDVGKSRNHNFVGEGIYLTTSYEDANTNYACVGPDLEGRIEDVVNDYDLFNDEEVSKTDMIKGLIGEYSLVLECELVEETNVLTIDKDNPVWFDLYSNSFDGEDFFPERSEIFYNIICVFESLGINYDEDDFEENISSLELLNYCDNRTSDYDNNLFAEIVVALGYDAVRFVNIGKFLSMYSREKHDHIIVFNKERVRIVNVYDNGVNTQQEYLKEHYDCVSY
jgi:hypothetical protein